MDLFLEEGVSEDELIIDGVRRVFGGEFDEGGGRRIEWVVVGWFCGRRVKSLYALQLFFQEKNMKGRRRRFSMLVFIYREENKSPVNICEGRDV